MPSPFPGMDPYLEDPADWPGFHHFLMTAAAGLLNQQLKPRGYYANVNERVWLEETGHGSVPDVFIVRRPSAREAAATTAVADEPYVIHIPPIEIHEVFLEIYDAKGKQIVTGIEIISPSNKAPGEGRLLYERKRKEWHETGLNFVEIDLLRDGKYLLDVPEESLTQLGDWDYLVNIVRAVRTNYEVYPIKLRERLPRIRIPLKTGDADGVLDLQAALNIAYDQGPYPDRLDYQAEPTPPLSPDDAAWADSLLRQAGLRK